MAFQACAQQMAHAAHTWTGKNDNDAWERYDCPGVSDPVVVLPRRPARGTQKAPKRPRRKGK